MLLLLLVLLANFGDNDSTTHTPRANWVRSLTHHKARDGIRAQS